MSSFCAAVPGERLVVKMISVGGIAPSCMESAKLPRGPAPICAGWKLVCSGDEAGLEAEIRRRAATRRLCCGVSLRAK